MEKIVQIVRLKIQKRSFEIFNRTFLHMMTFHLYLFFVLDVEIKKKLILQKKNVLICLCFSTVITCISRLHQIHIYKKLLIFCLSNENMCIMCNLHINMQILLCIILGKLLMFAKMAMQCLISMFK